MFFTNNNLNSLAADISETEKINSVSVAAWAGRASERFAFFRIVNDSETDKIVLVYSDNQDVELSLDKRHFAPALDYEVDANKVGDGLYVRCLAADDVEEGDRVATIKIVNESASLVVNYFQAQVNEGDTDDSQARRFSGDNTFEVAEFFETDGETVRIIEYTPQPKPTCLTNPFSFGELKNRKLEEWCNQFNEVVGYKASYHYSKAFVGDRDSLMNKLYNPKEISLTLSDTNSIILPHDFQGFNPSWQKILEPVGEITPGVIGYQGNVYTIMRDNFEYALRNIRRVGFFRGQILFYLAELVRVHYPGGASAESFLPWNEILDNDWKVIDYVKSWSLDPQTDEYCPYNPYLP